MPSLPEHFTPEPFTEPLPCTPPPAQGWWVGGPGDGSAIDVQNDNNGTLQGGPPIFAKRPGSAGLSASNGTTQFTYRSVNPEALKLPWRWMRPATPGITIDCMGKAKRSARQMVPLVAVVTKMGIRTIPREPAADAYGPVFWSNNNGTLEALAQLKSGAVSEVTLQGGVAFRSMLSPTSALDVSRQIRGVPHLVR